MKPNILFAIADDASHMGAYGHRWVSTPAFDRVARDGVLFHNAFTTNPKCAPSRASILTGRQTWQLEEACDHFGIFPGKFRVYPDLLEKAGYHVGYTGKGWAPGDFRRGGFKRNPAGPEYQGRTLTPPSSTISSKDYAANFRDFLAARPAGAPFCFWYGGHEPHRAYEEGEGVRNGADLGAIEVPPYLPDNETVRSDLADYAFELGWFDAQLGKILEALEESGELENTLVVVTADNGMPFPRVKGQIYEDDYRLPFAAMWPSQVSAGREVTDYVSFADIAPTFLEAAGVEPHPQMSGRSFVDVMTSTGALASGGGHSTGAAPRPGAVRIDPTRDRIVLGRERHDVGRENDAGYPVRCIRTDDWLYVRNFEPDRWPAGNPETGFTNIDGSPTKSFILDQHRRGEEYYFQLAMGKRGGEELYDLRTDPHCVNNLASDPQYDAVKHDLWTELEGYLRGSGDPRIFGRGEVFDTYEYVGRGDHSWKNYVEGTWRPQGY
jgi:arylsulfatase A-like enzyme